MSIELKVPAAGESITEVVIVEWSKKEGDHAERDELLALIETDKANVEVLAPEAGTLARILKQAGESARVGEAIGVFEAGASEAKAATSAPTPAAAKPPASPPQPAQRAEPQAPQRAEPQAPQRAEPPASARTPPSTRRALREHREGNGHNAGAGDMRGAKEIEPRESPKAPPPPSPQPPAPAPTTASPEERIVPMTPLRQRVAERLVQAQHNAALLTTFNEVDMSQVIALRKQHADAFKERHGVKLGFMSFFVKAAVEALRAFPAINAEIRGTNIVYRDHADIGVAVGGGKGLVVPTIRNAERRGFAEIERMIGDFAERAKSGRLRVDELQGGTFTISNGGVYGSLLSTPIVNPPQSGILGMHTIQERPVARAGQVVIAPMMYLALTYDHRIVDGREAVGFLVRIKECVENPTRLLLEV